MTRTGEGPVHGPFDVRVAFSEDVTGFEAADISAENGAVVEDSFTAVEARTWTAQISPAASGTVSVSVPADAAHAGQIGNTASDALTVEADLSVPAVTVTRRAEVPVAGPFSVRVTFSKAVTGFAIADLSVEGGTATGLVSPTGETWHDVLISPSDGAAVIAVTVPAGVVEDLAGRPNGASETLRIAVAGAGFTARFEERAALVALYNATGGANWTINTNWLTNEALSEWHRVETDEDGRVTALRLVANELNGEIPAELGNLSNLQVLSLSTNTLSGEIPPELGDLANLQELYLNDNELTGEIPPELENLAQLQVFDIRNTGLCVTAGSELHTWLATIDFQGAVCATTPPPRPPPPPPPPRPRTSAPGAPSNLTAVGGDGQVLLTWGAPASDGGTAVTDYEYRINRSDPWISIGSTGTTHTVTGLVNGTAYVFEVRAVNKIGRGRVSNRAEAKPEAFTLDFAHFANGDGLTSDLVFVNVGTHPIRPALSFYDTDGQPMPAESVVEITGDLEIQEDGSLSIQTAMEPLGELTISTHGQGELVSGSVRVVAFGPIGGVLRFDLPGIGVAGVGTSLPVRDAVFPVRRQEAGINTGVAIHNLESSPELVRCELMREGVLHDAVSLPLAANGQASWFIDAAFPAADTSDFAGSVHCDAAGPGMFTAVALELDAVNRIFTTLPVLPVRRAGGRAAELNFAHFANGAGLTSDLVFVNLSTERSRPAPTPFHSDILPARPALYFYGTEGALVSAESVVDITGDLAVMEDGGLTVRTEMDPLGVLTISTHGRGELVSGSVRVVADEPIGGVLRFDLPGIGVAGVGASPPVHDALFPVRRQEAGINTGVALHNLGEEAMEVTCELMQGGTVLDDASIPLAANGQSSWFINEVFTGADTSDFAGSVRCTAPGEGMFTGVAVELDAANRIFTTLPVVPVPERMSQE